MKNFKNNSPYCKSALFTCKCCSYATTIYSDTEWLQVTEKLFCSKCNGACDRNYDAGIIYRDDIDEEIHLHMQMTQLPEGKYHCDNCTEHNSLIHWTEQLVNCPVCKMNTMLFTKYTTGKNIVLFYEQCVEAVKHVHPPIKWIEKKGHKIIVINGLGEGFSAT